MIDWAVVAAFIAPLIGAIGLVAGWFTFTSKKRDERVSNQIQAVTTALELRISQVEKAIETQGKHLDKQDEALQSAMTAIARIEGRLAGPISTIAS